MAFQTTPNDDYNFRVNGWSSGGSVTTDVNGRRKTEAELLDYASRYSYPDDGYTNPIVKGRLLKLKERYQDPNWQRHFSGTENEREKGK